MTSSVSTNRCTLSSGMLSEFCLVLVNSALFWAVAFSIFWTESKTAQKTCLAGRSFSFTTSISHYMCNIKGLYLTTNGKNTASLESAIQQWTWSYVVFRTPRNFTGGFLSKTSKHCSTITPLTTHRLTCSCGASYIGQKQSNLRNRIQRNRNQLLIRLVSLQAYAGNADPQIDFHNCEVVCNDNWRRLPILELFSQ